jgi:hypothetical protein
VGIESVRSRLLARSGRFCTSWTSKGGKSTFLKHGTESKFFKKRCDWTGKKHSDESISKMSESKKGKFTKENNSQYNTCWITNGVESKKINKEDNIPNGWKLGRKMPK